MSDIFISYAREDLARAQKLANALQKEGWSVFWDRTIPAGKTWRDVIGKALAEARCVLVAWSTKSIESPWVIEEADEGRERGILVPVLVDVVKPPIGFRNLQAADLIGWDGVETSPAFRTLVADIAGILGSPVKTEAGQVTSVETKEAGTAVVEREKESAPAPPEVKPPAEPPRPEARPALFRPSPVPKVLPWLIGGVLIVGAFVAFWVFQAPSRVSTVVPPSPRPDRTTLQPEVPKQKVEVPTLPKEPPRVVIKKSSEVPSPPTLKSVPEKEAPKKIAKAPAPKITPPAPTKIIPAKDMVLIPAGEFWMGCNEKVDRQCQNDEKPGGNVYLKAFAIDKYNVTVADYRKCVEAGTCSSDGLTKWGRCNWDKPGREDHPIDRVNWYQSTTYCAWAGKRLPTEAEWEKAARGTDGRIYPWGNQWDSSRAQVGVVGTVSVGSYPSGVSPYGVHDMAGDVWEWTSSLDKPYPYKPNDGREDPKAKKDRVLRGGSWGPSPEDARTSDRFTSHPGLTSFGTGFRCAKTP